MHTSELLGAFALAVALALVSSSVARQAHPEEEKMKPRELVAKHLASIGAAEARAAIKNRVMNGRAQVVFRLGSSGSSPAPVHLSRKLRGYASR